MKEQKVPKEVVIAGITALTILEVVAMLSGFNGTTLRIISALIALAIGVTIPTPKLK